MKKKKKKRPAATTEAVTTEAATTEELATGSFRPPDPSSGEPIGSPPAEPAEETREAATPVSAALPGTGDDSSSGVVRLVVVFGLAVSVLLLAVAAVPPWVVRDPRTAALLAAWRVQIAAAGFSALLAVGVVYLVQNASL